MIKLLISFTIIIFLSCSSYAQDEPDSVIVIKGSRTVPEMDSTDPNKIIIIDGIPTENPINNSPESIDPYLLDSIKVLIGELGADYENSSFRGTVTYFKYIAHSIGFAPDESKPAFFISISTRISNNLYLGLHGGIYTFERNLDSTVSDTIRAHAPYNAGGYTFESDFITQGLSYIGAVLGSYFITNNISLRGSAGIRLYSEDTWHGSFSFGSPSNNWYPPNAIVTPNMNFEITGSETKLKPYFSLGADYKTDKFLIGVYGDNLYSFGITLGMGFN